MKEDLLALGNFNGIARLFPLPNLVLFPFVVQGLHIFEPRYRQMTADALADDRLIAMALLKPGWEPHYEGWPELHSVACLGRIVADQQLEDGRYNLHLRGLCRVQILEELKTAKMYRNARVELLADANAPVGIEESELRRRLQEAVAPWTPTQEPGKSMFRKLLASELSIGTICDVLGYALPLALATKQQLLETLDVQRRTHLLLEYLSETTPPTIDPPGGEKFPPDFSEN